MSSVDAIEELDTRIHALENELIDLRHARATFIALRQGHGIPNTLESRSNIRNNDGCAKYGDGLPVHVEQGEYNGMQFFVAIRTYLGRRLAHHMDAAASVGELTTAIVIGQPKSRSVTPDHKRAQQGVINAAKNRDDLFVIDNCADRDKKNWVIRLKIDPQVQFPL